MSEHILKWHNKPLILYHIVCPAKYRQKVLTEKVELSLKNICVEIGKRYEIHFLEIGTDEVHVHFLCPKCPHHVTQQDCANNQGHHCQENIQTSYAIS